jgi:hypothetical protein
LWEEDELVRCVLSNVGLWDKHGLWAEAASVACYLISRSPNSATKWVKEPIWMRGLISELVVAHNVIKGYCDNQSAICLTKDDMYQFKTKHIDIKYHFIRDIVAEGKIKVNKIHTDENPADMLTKPLSNSKFKHCLDLVGVCGA